MSYNSNVEIFQHLEYPMLEGTTYLDHGGTTIYAKSLVETVAADLVSNLYGNPHSASDPAMLSGRMVDETRIKTLEFFGADPEHFDLVFVANATAAIKLVMESFKDLGNSNRDSNGEVDGFRYFYHVDAHNSLVGVRETAGGDHHCFRNDAEVERWLSGKSAHNGSTKVGLFAYPGQSNMTGRRLPLSWTGRLRNSTYPQHRDTYSLLDAAALATTCPLNDVFRDPELAPDFTALSFYKIFGYPDLGGLIVRKSSGNILQWGRKYFGGGTVQVVTVLGSNPWFKFRETLHESLEDGTLPFHSILALNAAIDTHRRLYGYNCMATISHHTSYLGKRLHDQLTSLKHPNGSPLCTIYNTKEATYGDSATQGATIAFNVQTPDGKYVPYTSIVETLANERKIFVRAGQLCNPGGVATYLGFEDWHIRRLWADGHRCSAAQDTGTEIIRGKPTGVVRVSMGAMTTIANLDTLIAFLREEFIAPSVASPLYPAQVVPRLRENQMPIRAREEKLSAERQFLGQMMMGRDDDTSPGAAMMNGFPPTPNSTRPPTRTGTGTPNYAFGSVSGRSETSLVGRGFGADYHVGGGGGAAGEEAANFHVRVPTPRRPDRGHGGPPTVATDFDQLLGVGAEFGTARDGSVYGDDREERSGGLKRLWKHRTRKQSLVGSVI